MKTDAVISPCGRYRYRLSRIWDTSKPAVCWVMLNPSTADATVDDPTIRRCLGFTRFWGGYGGILVVNLFAYRAMEPRVMLSADDPIGPENDRHILETAAGRRVIAAWGARGGYRHRDAQVVRLLTSYGIKVECLGLTRGRMPRHPLYLRQDAGAVPFALAGEAA